MKLLFCSKCGDVFNLQRRPKSCFCGDTVGMYTDNSHAEVNGKGYSLAIGNGSLFAALERVNDKQPDWRETDNRDPYARKPTSIICWARPHSGCQPVHDWRMVRFPAIACHVLSI